MKHVIKQFLSALMIFVGVAGAILALCFFFRALLDMLL